MSSDKNKHYNSKNLSQYPPVETTGGENLGGRRPETHMAAPDLPAQSGEAVVEPEDIASFELGRSAVLLGEIKGTPVQELTEDELEKKFFKDHVVSMSRVQREGLVKVGGVEHRIFEPTDAPGYGGVRNRLAHILLADPTLLFVKYDNGFQAYGSGAAREYLSDDKSAETNDA